MTFEKEFPSLSKEFQAQEVERNLGKIIVYPEWQIQQHCLDKQRVLEAVRKVQIEWDKDGEKIGLGNDILKELGL